MSFSSRVTHYFLEMITKLYLTEYYQNTSNVIDEIIDPRIMIFLNFSSLSS